MLLRQGAVSKCFYMFVSRPESAHGGWYVIRPRNDVSELLGLVSSDARFAAV